MDGTVSDPSHAVIPGAMIALIDAKTGTVLFQTTADSEGKFSLTVAPGNYRIEAYRAGFARSVRQIDPSAGARVTIDFILGLDGRATTVQVTAQSGYSPGTIRAATGMPMPLKDIPQTVNVLTNSLLQDRGVDSMQQAVEIVPTVGIQAGEGRRDNFYIRGFNAMTDMYVDGVRDDAQYYRDLSNTQSIEVIEGPAAALYGRGSSGGLIDRVTKKPRMEGPLSQFSFTGGSYGRKRFTADMDMFVPGADRKLGFRLTGAAESGGSFRHHYWMSRYAFAPTLLWRPSSRTQIYAQIERLRDDRLPDRGIPMVNGAPADVPIGTFYGYVGPASGNNFTHVSAVDGTIAARQQFQDGWTVHEIVRQSSSMNNFLNMIPQGVVGGDVSLSAYHVIDTWHEIFDDLEAYRSAHFLGMLHTFLVGGEYGRETLDFVEYKAAGNTLEDLRNPQLTPPPPFGVDPLASNRFLGQTAAVFGQDLIHFAKRWDALVGVRYDNYKQSLENRTLPNGAGNLDRTDNAASPRVGVVYHAAGWASLYGNYSRTFTPAGDALTLAANDTDLKPETTQNYEGGAKFSSFHHQLLTSVNLYRLDRTNVLTTDPSNPNLLINAGEQRTDGAGVTFQGNLTPRWMVYGGYAWMDARILHSSTVSNGVSFEGKRPMMVPLHSGSLWMTYQLENGFGFGGGVIGRARQFASDDNLAILPTYAAVNAAVYYRKARYEIDAHLNNVGDLRYYDAAQSDNQIYPAAPINGSITLRYRF